MDLPEECWAKIFGYLYADQNAAIRRTCHSWNAKISLQYSQLVLDPNEPGYILSKPLLNYSNAMEALATESGHLLTKLTIKDTISEESMLILKDNCPNLQTLKCGWLKTGCFVLLDCKSLKHLSIKRFSDNCDLGLETDVREQFSHIGDLESLEITCLPTEQANILANLPANCCLRKLKIIEQGRKLQPFSNQQLHDLCARPSSAQIAEFHLIDCIFISQLRPLISLKNLRELHTPGCNSLKNGCGIEIIAGPPVGIDAVASDGLTTLCISGLQRLSDFTFLRVMKSLKQLDVEDCRHFVSESLNNLSPSCQLDNLNISYSGAVNDASLKIITSQNHPLRHLKAENEDDAVRGITSTGVDSLLSIGKCLETLSLSYNRDIDDSVFQAFKNHHANLPNLRNIDLYGINCTQPGFESFLRFRSNEMKESGAASVSLLRIGLMLNQYSRISEELFAKANVEILRYVNLRD